MVYDTRTLYVGDSAGASEGSGDSCIGEVTAIAAEAEGEVGDTGRGAEALFGAWCDATDGVHERAVGVGTVAVGGSMLS